MDTFDVVVWEDSLSDGSTCYAAWCSYVLGVSGQGDTEAEALEDITSAMTDVIHYPWDDGVSLADFETAAAEMADVMRELSAEGTSFNLHRVSIPAKEPASV
jgi:predicted RNase H-like HicB family nuclease